MAKVRLTPVKKEFIEKLDVYLDPKNSLTRIEVAGLKKYFRDEIKQILNKEEK